MSRNPEYEFVPLDAAALVDQMVADYEARTGETLVKSSPEYLMISWVASVILQSRVKSNYAANQNLPSRAEGENLDALAELFFAPARTPAQPAVCMVRFHISAAQASSILVPAGTRVTDASHSLYWETLADAWIAIGDTYTDAQVRCQTPGTVGNAWAPGSLNSIVDVFDYYTACENITESDGGAEELTDDEYYELLRASMDSMSTAGARGNYIFHAKAVSSEILDVVVNSPYPGEIRIYVLGTDADTGYPVIAGQTLKDLVLAACNGDSVRPLTDYVLVADADEVSYDIEATYFISSQAESTSSIAEEVDAAVRDYIIWQQGKLGRDINPSKLISKLMSIGGIKRVEVSAPAYTVLRDGNLSLYDEGDSEIVEEETVPQIGKIDTVSVVNGGVEDE